MMASSHATHQSDPGRTSHRSVVVSFVIALAILMQPLGMSAAGSFQSSAGGLTPVRSSRISGDQAAHDLRAIISRPVAAKPASGEVEERAPVPQLSADTAPAVAASTTVTVSILSTPHATHDSNSNADPSVWVVEAVITNTGPTTATTPIVDLNMNSNPNWYLLPGESRQRTLASFPPGGVQTLYWLAHRSNTIPDPHTYTITVSATNVNKVTQSLNVYENPSGQTVDARSALSTGNNGVVNTAANVTVGVAFTMSVDYDMGNNAQGVTLQPNGDISFNPAAYRLLANEVQFRDAGNAPVEPLYRDRLYFPPGSLPSGAQKVKTVYTFVALQAANAKLCPYTDVKYASNNKFDQFYCDVVAGTVVNITGTLSFSLTKSVNALTVQEGQLLTYTLRYTNSGSFPIQNAYIWDNIPSHTVTSTVTPAPDPTEGFNTQDRIVWNVGTVGPSGSLTSTGAVTATVLVNGRGTDIPDGTQLVNNGFMGILFNPDAPIAAVTSTVTTTVLAPSIAINKDDNQTNVIQGQYLTYTLRITNTGAEAATSMLITDALPSGVTYSGGAVPAPAGPSGQTLTWTIPSLAGGGGIYTITLPISVNFKLANGTLLTNTMRAQYSNQANYTFSVQSANDEDVVQSPILSIIKTDFPNPVISGRNVTYTLRITNTGPATATGVLITDVLPISTTYVSCSGGTSCGINASQVVSWAAGSIAPSTTAVVTFTAHVSTGLTSGTTIVNQNYGVVSDQTDFLAGAPQMTTVFNAVAVVTGKAYLDANQNGVLDGGETGIPSITVTLPGALQPVTVTNASGQYRFALEQAGPISVSAEIPPAHFRTTSSPVFLTVTLETTSTVNFGYCDASCGMGVVYGTVFNDMNHNSVQELGENGLSDVNVSSVGAMTTPVTTNEFGQYTLAYNSASVYTVTETNPANYVSTTPDSVAQSVSLNASSQVDFGDFLGVRIQGKVFDDQNVNATNDAEPGVSGAIVAGGGDSLTTAVSGDYVLFATVQPGQPVTVTETDPADYISTAAIPGSASVIQIDPNTLRLDNPISGTVYSDNDFGDVLASSVISISGQVFNDANADGLYNDGGVGLAEARVSASTGMFITTTASGNFTLYGPANTAITVTETNPAGYVSTDAIPGSNATKFDLDTLRVSVLLTGTTSANNYFGDVILSSASVITGVLFNDGNNNGVFDPGEGVFSGQQVLISGTVSLITTTAANGMYAFAVGSGSYVVSSTVPAGYYRTTPESLVVDAAVGTTYPNNNFGFSNNTSAATMYGTVFNDYNGNGLQDLGEVGLPAGVVQLISGTTTVATYTTGVVGTYAFTVAQAGPWRVRETNPPGYFSTSPDQINLVVALGNSYQVNFGDSNRTDVGSVHGLVFDDLNANGIQDPTDPGIAGVVITTTADNGTDVVSATTQSAGQYSYGFDFVSQGFHTVYEINPPGYRSTTPDVAVVNVLLGSAVVVDFGDCQVGVCSPVIQGTVFNDASGDGIQDLTELGLPGVTVTLYSGITLITQTATRSNGDYTFGIAQNGVYRVVETDPPFYHSTTPNDVHVSVVTSDTYIVNFGDSNNPAQSSIFGTAFNDSNTDGIFDANEVGIAGVPVHIDGNTGSSITDAETNYLGQYTFLIDQSGLFTVTESDLAGYVSTTPNVVTQSVTLNNSYAVDFGDYNGGGAGGIRIEGRVFNDLNLNSLDDSEPGIGGVVVTATFGTSSTTPVSGQFVLFAPSNAGPITITEGDLLGYTSTVAIAGAGAAVIDVNNLRITLPVSGTVYTGNEFGDSAGTIRIEGVVFLDANANGLDDDGQVVSGAVIAASGGTSATASITGTFVVLAPSNIGPITVTETDPPGYVSTAAIAGGPGVTAIDANRLLVVSPNSGAIYVGNKFGDFNGAQVLGSIFNDRDVNGLWDVAYEPRITTTLVTLAGSGGLSAQTAATGVYTMYAKVLGGFVSVTEVVPSGYVATTPTKLTFPATPGQVYSDKDFGLLPPECGADSYETLNDNLYTTTGVTLTAGASQLHSFHSYDDKDWVKVTLKRGYGYTFTTAATGARADTVLVLFGPNGVTQLAQSDDSGATDFSSQIHWVAAADGTYYLRVTQLNPALAGCNTNYSLSMSIAPKYFIYAPLVTRNYP